MKRYSETVVDIFNKHASKYDSWYERNRVTAENEAKLVIRTASSFREPCIEIGGGTGYFSDLLGCVNLDPSREMLTISRRKRGLETIEGYGEFLPIRSESIGLVLIVVTICFVESPVDLIRESYRVLRKDGSLVLCMIPRDSQWGAYYAGKRDSPFYRVARFLTKREAIDLLAGFGFHVEEILGTLSYSPLSQPYSEDPSPLSDSHGFICIRAVKINNG
ncbi:MAG: methyltransferase domain-containing protein [Sulfolobales archaeon]